MKIIRHRAQALCLMALFISYTSTFAQMPAIPANSEHRGAVLYQYPLQNSVEVTPLTDIGIRANAAYDPELLNASTVSVIGSKSGQHLVTLHLSRDQSVAIIHPTYPFVIGETVHVEFSAGTVEGRSVTDSFSFSTRSRDIPQVPYDMERETIAAMAAHAAHGHTHQLSVQDEGSPDLSFLSVTSDYGATPGRIYLSNFGFQAIDNPSYLINLDEKGRLLHYLDLDSNHALDYKVQSNGTITYFNFKDDAFYAIDSNWNVLDTFHNMLGYSSDPHELQLLPGGNYALIALEVVPVDMSQYVVGGDTTAEITGNVVQIFDADHNLIFNWRGLDHYKITDALNISLTTHTIDFEHANCLDFDSAGNFILSNRHLSEITKINAQTGEILWRFGGAHNQFTLLGDSVWFSYQHSARLLPNNHLMLFDNSNFDSVAGPAGVYFNRTRGVEYVMDTSAMTATLVWAFHHDPEVFTSAMGDVQRLPNGNTFMGWGANDDVAITEVRARDNKAIFEMKMSGGNYSYRAFKDPDTTREIEAVNPTEQAAASGVSIEVLAGLRIRYTVPQSGAISLRVVDVLGRTVRQLVSGEEAGGSHERSLGAPLQAGAYWCVLQTASGTITCPVNIAP